MQNTRILSFLLWLACAYSYSKFDDITKGDFDNSSYRYLQLENGLEALIAAAAMMVRVGSYRDPPGTLGLAHFLEHMLFMGTEKYPSEDEFDHFLTNHGGFSNAYTSATATNFFFDVYSDHLLEALDRFSQFFTAPLLKKDCVDREMQAVQAEHEKNLINDRWRINQATKLLFNQSHPESRFKTGSLETLDKPNIREELKTFYDQNYSSDLMKLVIVGQESLDQLEDFVVEKFKDVPRRATPELILDTNPFGTSARGKVLKVKTISPMDELTLTFQLPSVKNENKKEASSILSHIIGYDGHGGLSAGLKKAGLVTSVLSDSSSVRTDSYTFLEITLTLTQKGFEQYQVVVCNVLDYLTLLKNNEIPEYVISDVVKMAKTSFNFKPKKSNIKFVSSKVEDMFNYEPQNILSGPYMYGTFDKEVSKELLKYVDSNNMCVILASNRFDDTDFKTEPWYGTKYSIESLVLTNVDPATYTFPAKNPLLPEDFSVFGKEAEVPMEHPEKFISRKNITVWYKQDDTFMLPHSSYHFRLKSKVMYGSRASVLTGLMTEMIANQLEALFYDAKLAGLSCAILATYEGLDIIFHGYSDKLAIFMSTLGREITKMTLMQSDFEIVRDELAKSFDQVQFQSAFRSADIESTLALSFPGDDDKKNAKIVREISLDELLAFMAQLFESSLDVEALVMGNVKQQDALNHVDAFLDSLIPGFTMTERLPNVVLNAKLEEGESSTIAKEVKDTNYAALFYMQLGRESDYTTRVMMLLFYIAFNNDVYQVLRTQQSLGYMVHLGQKQCGVFAGLEISVQSPNVNPIELELRIKEVLSVNISKKLQSMSTADYETVRQSAKNVLKEKFSNLGEESVYYWSKIIGRSYDFRSWQNEVAVLKGIDLEDFRTYSTRMIINCTKNLNVHLWPEGKIQKEYDGMHVYNDYSEFRQDHVFIR